MMHFRLVRAIIVFIIAVTVANVINSVFSLWYYPSFERVPKTGSSFPELQLYLTDKALSQKNDIQSTNIVEMKKENLERFAAQLSSDRGKKSHKWDQKILCPEIPPGLGPVKYNETMLFEKLNDKSKTSPQIAFGGYNKINNCTPQEIAAIIIPFTELKYLMIFINYLHNFLRKQQLEYQVFVVKHRHLNRPYNRGMLLNAAFTEILKRFPNRYFHCFIIHEPTILPVNTMNLYRCSWNPRHFVADIQRDSISSLKPAFGGVVALTHEQLIKVNGFSNVYPHKDADFQDMFKRLTQAHYIVERTSPAIGHYVPLLNRTFNNEESEQDQNELPLNLNDGLSTISYLVNLLELRNEYTYIEISTSIPETTKNNYFQNFVESMKRIVI